MTQNNPVPDPTARHSATDAPYVEDRAATPADPALLLRIEQDGRNSMSGCMRPADIPALLRQLADRIAAQLGQPSPPPPDAAVPPTLATLRDLIAADPGVMTIGEALASARTVLAAHTRELADIAHAEGAALYDDMGQKAAAGAWYVRDRLRALADEFDRARAVGGEQA